MASTTEHPMRLDDLERSDGFRRQISGRDVDAVEVPPLVAIGDDDERPITPPERLLECLVTVADEPASVAHRRTVEVRDPQFGRVPRHVRVHPLDPHERAPVRRHPRRCVEVGTGRDHLGTHRTVGGHRDDLVDRLAVTVTLVDAHIPLAVGGRSPVGVSQSSRHRRFRGQQHRLTSRLDPAQALVAELAVVGNAVGGPPCSPAVLVHARANVDLGWRHILRRPVAPAHERGSSAIVRA